MKHPTSLLLVAQHSDVALLRLMFTWLDLDRTGKLTADNLRLLVGKLGAGANDSPGARLGGKSAMVVVNEILGLSFSALTLAQLGLHLSFALLLAAEKFDANGDGVIDFDEFKEINTHFPELLGAWCHCHSYLPSLIRACRHPGSVFFLQSLVSTSTGLPLGRGLGDKSRLIFRDSGTLVQPQLGRAKSSRSVKLHPHPHSSTGVGVAVGAGGIGLASGGSSKHHIHAGQHMRGVSRHERKAMAISKSFSADPQSQQHAAGQAPVAPTSPNANTSTIGGGAGLEDAMTVAHLRKPSVSTVVVKTVTTVETITTTTVHGDAADVAAVVAAAESADNTPPSMHTGNAFVPLGSVSVAGDAAARAGSPQLISGELQQQAQQAQQPPHTRQNSHPTTIGGRPAASGATLRRSTGGRGSGSGNSILGLGLAGVRSSGSPRGSTISLDPVAAGAGGASSPLAAVHS